MARPDRGRGTDSRVGRKIMNIMAMVACVFPMAVAQIEPNEFQDLVSSTRTSNSYPLKISLLKPVRTQVRVACPQRQPPESLTRASEFIRSYAALQSAFISQTSGAKPLSTLDPVVYPQHQLPGSYSNPTSIPNLPELSS